MDAEYNVLSWNNDSMQQFINSMILFAQFMLDAYEKEGLPMIRAAYQQETSNLLQFDMEVDFKEVPSEEHFHAIINQIRSMNDNIIEEWTKIHHSDEAFPYKFQHFQFLCVKTRETYLEIRKAVFQLKQLYGIDLIELMFETVWNRFSATQSAENRSVIEPESFEQDGHTSKKRKTCY
jgi:hypothetical protein